MTLGYNADVYDNQPVLILFLGTWCERSVRQKLSEKADVSEYPNNSYISGKQKTQVGMSGQSRAVHVPGSHH